MKKTLTRILMLAACLALLQASVPNAAASSNGPGAFSLPAVFVQPNQDDPCEHATVFFLSYPAKCLTADGLKVSSPRPGRMVPAGSP
jgi:hypothetical protein